MGGKRFLTILLRKPWQSLYIYLKQIKWKQKKHKGFINHEDGELINAEIYPSDNKYNFYSNAHRIFRDVDCRLSLVERKEEVGRTKQGAGEMVQ